MPNQIDSKGFVKPYSTHKMKCGNNFAEIFLHFFFAKMAVFLFMIRLKF